jgi:hypothetical protein
MMQPAHHRLGNQETAMYNPIVGRWMEEDPILFKAGDADLYRDVGNDPTNSVDPSGLQAEMRIVREMEGRDFDTSLYPGNGVPYLTFSFSRARLGEKTVRGRKVVAMDVVLSAKNRGFDVDQLVMVQIVRDVRFTVCSIRGVMPHFSVSILCSGSVRSCA